MDEMSRIGIQNFHTFPKKIVRSDSKSEFNFSKKQPEIDNFLKIPKENGITCENVLMRFHN